DRWDAHLLPILGRDKALEPAHAGLAEAFGVCHDVRLRDWHEIRRSEEFADLDLVLQGLLQDRTTLARKNMLLFVVELHRSQSGVAPDVRPPNCQEYPPLAQAAGLDVRLEYPAGSGGA